MIKRFINLSCGLLFMSLLSLLQNNWLPQAFRSGTYTFQITREHMNGWRHVVTDDNPIHYDHEAAREAGFVDTPAYGTMLTAHAEYCLHQLLEYFHLNGTSGYTARNLSITLKSPVYPEDKDHPPDTIRLFHEEGSINVNEDGDVYFRFKGIKDKARGRENLEVLSAAVKLTRNPIPVDVPSSPVFYTKPIPVTQQTLDIYSSFAPLPGKCIPQTVLFSGINAVCLDLSRDPHSSSPKYDGFVRSIALTFFDLPAFGVFDVGVGLEKKVDEHHRLQTTELRLWEKLRTSGRLPRIKRFDYVLAASCVQKETGKLLGFGRLECLSNYDFTPSSVVYER